MRLIFTIVVVVFHYHGRIGELYLVPELPFRWRVRDERSFTAARSHVPVFLRELYQESSTVGLRPRINDITVTSSRYK